MSFLGDRWQRAQLRFMARNPRWLWRGLANWCHGYRFEPMGRCRRCDHTTPHHYPTCLQARQGESP